MKWRQRKMCFPFFPVPGIIQFFFCVCVSISGCHLDGPLFRLSSPHVPYCTPCPTRKSVSHLHFRSQIKKKKQTETKHQQAASTRWRRCFPVYCLFNGNTHVLDENHGCQPLNRTFFISLCLYTVFRFMSCVIETYIHHHQNQFSLFRISNSIGF